MSVVPSKSSLKRVSAKSTLGGSQKKPRFSQHRSAEKDRSGSTPSVAPASETPPPILIVDLGAALDSIPSFDECIEHLPSYSAEGLSKGKEKAAPLLAEEVEVVGPFARSSLSRT